MLNLVDSQDHGSLTMSLRLLVALSPPHFEYNGLLTLDLFFNRGVDACVLNRGTADSCVIRRANH